MKDSLFQDLLESIKSLPTNVLKEMEVNMEQEQMREEFEQWAVKERAYSIERFESEPRQYVEQNTHIAWTAWKASREHLVV